MKLLLNIFLILTQYMYASDIYYYKNNQIIDLTPVDKISRDVSRVDYYKNNQGIILGVTDKLIVKLKDDKYLEQILNEFNLTLENTLSKNMYLLKTTNKNLTIDISNRLDEKEYIEYSQPDFIKKRVRR